ncbi:putative serine/threonine protein kinase [Cardiosporidium cionae]|uniref:Serine/threonine protein kinase n=1 Tax=Cardiosporidium cionae TaxID=476202 RepID=A0ABQ7JGV1_9APIC|nr:putative serine/threonine protein kinase [Cardiosporidium cionae]|eukprot:KAF8822940.1 putative serine/threonine protein kinase [Cardiosporidium cionae]
MNLSEPSTTAGSSSENGWIENLIGKSIGQDFVSEFSKQDSEENEDFTALRQLLHRLQRADTYTSSLIQAFCAPAPQLGALSAGMDDALQRGITRGNKLYNILVSTSQMGYAQRMRHRYDGIFSLFLLKNYAILDQIGTGQYSHIFVGMDRNTEKEIVAKVVDAKKIKENQILEMRFKDEMTISSQVKHGNVVQTENIIYFDDKIVQIMEYCDGGDLRSYICQRGFLCERSVKYFFKNILEGVQYLHHSGIVHRDLKLENLLLLRTRKLANQKRNENRLPVEDFVIKIGDFGESTYFKDGKLLFETLGTLSYAAPEVLAAGGIHGYEAVPADIWSLGIILYVMLFGCLPWNNEKLTTIQCYNKLIQERIPFPANSVSPDAIQFVESLLQIDPKMRPTLLEIKLNKWLL